jgi:hypothetical protein
VLARVDGSVRSSTALKPQKVTGSTVSSEAAGPERLDRALPY